MLISLNWLKKYVDVDIANDELVKLIGARLVEVEEAIDQTRKYDKIYAVKVLECEAIEGTHLHRCLIDDGGKATDVKRDADGHVQVMCGAPNVHADMMAAWIAPGATVPASVHDAEPFVIGMRRMLGKYDSYGMLAAMDELDLGDGHDGIIELDPATAKPGDSFAKLFELDDIILDIENKSLTHRPDTFGIIGFAREVAGILGKSFQTPSWYRNEKASFATDKSVKLEIETDKDLCSRYVALVLSADEVQRSPYLSLQDTYLARSGMRPIDPVVDLTNILMLLSGQPLHAFDYDKFVKVGNSKTPKIIVRAAKAGEKLTLLDGKEVEMTADDIVITSNNIPVALAGAMGGANTEIDDNTKHVILESATFSLYNLRKTQMAHGVFSEAITRFTKGQPAGQTMPVALEFAVRSTDFGYQPLAVFDSQKSAPKADQVKLKLPQINELLGTNFQAAEVQKILENVEFAVKADKSGNFTVTAPFWRTDIHIPEDVIEEVGRLSGYDNIAPVLPLHATSTPNGMFGLKTQIRNILSGYGANEVLTYSFVHGDLMVKVGQDLENAYRIVNSISPDLQYIRQNILPSLLDKAYGNLRAGHGQFAIFEMNQAYSRAMGMDEDGVPNNTYNLALLYVDDKSDSCYYQTKLYIERLLMKLGIEVSFQPYTGAADHHNDYYEGVRSAAIVAGDQTIGHIGEIKNSVLRKFKLPTGTAGFELKLQDVIRLAGTRAKSYRFSQYPSVSRDVTVTVPADATYAPLEVKFRAALEEKDLLYQLSCTSIYRAEGSDTKNISFHIDFSNPTHTLAKNEIQVIMEVLEKIK